MPLYLGLDAGAIGLTAVVIDIHDERRDIVFNRTLAFDRDLPEYGIVTATPVMWADALDRLLGRLAAAAEIEVEDIRAIAGSFSSREHSPSAYLTPSASRALAPSAALAGQLTAAGSAIDSLGLYLETLLADSNRRLAAYWQKRYALPAAAIVPWTGDRESRSIGIGLARDGVLGIAFGTNDVVSTRTETIAFRNGSLARDWARRAYGLEWDGIAAMLSRSPGNDGGILLPWLEPEDTPRVAHAGVRRFGFDRHDAARNICGLIEGQMMAMANHADAISGGTLERIVATGDAAEHHAILQVAANVFGADVYRLETDGSAALGAALRAYHADRLATGAPVSWTTVVRGFADPKPGHRVAPNPKHVAMYAELRRDYAILERLHRDRPPIC